MGEFIISTGLEFDIKIKQLKKDCDRNYKHPKLHSLGHKPYQRLSRLMKYRFIQKMWNSDNIDKKSKITEGHKSLFWFHEKKVFEIN